MPSPSPKKTFLHLTNRLSTVATLLGILWSNQIQRERQAMFLFIISQHIHLRPHRKRFHAKYTSSKMLRRQERGKTGGWFTAEEPTSKMLPGFPLGNNCCICKQSCCPPKKIKHGLGEHGGGRHGGLVARAGKSNYF